MDKYEVILHIMADKILGRYDKVYLIEMFLKGWYTEKDLEWVWNK